MGQPQTFRSPTALVAWIVWLLFAAANWIDLAVQGRDHGSAVAAAILLLATGFGYVTAQRPRIVTDDAGVTIRNPLRDHRAGWAAVTKVDLADLLRVHCEQRVISAWAVHYARRRKLAAEVRARRAANPRRVPLGLGQAYGAAATARNASPAEAEAEKIARHLAARAETARAETASVEAGTAEPLTSTWSGRAIAALAIPALILLIVSLL